MGYSQIWIYQERLLILLEAFFRKPALDVSLGQTGMGRCIILVSLEYFFELLNRLFMPAA